MRAFDQISLKFGPVWTNLDVYQIIKIISTVFRNTGFDLKYNQHWQESVVRLWGRERRGAWIIKSRRENEANENQISCLENNYCMWYKSYPDSFTSYVMIYKLHVEWVYNQNTEDGKYFLPWHRLICPSHKMQGKE